MEIYECEYLFTQSRNHLKSDYAYIVLHLSRHLSKRLLYIHQRSRKFSWTFTQPTSCGILSYFQLIPSVRIPISISLYLDEPSSLFREAHTFCIFLFAIWLQIRKFDVWNWSKSTKKLPLHRFWTFPQGPHRQDISELKNQLRILASLLIYKSSGICYLAHSSPNATLDKP